jgi:hypothetical protein
MVTDYSFACGKKGFATDYTNCTDKYRGLLPADFADDAETICAICVNPRLNGRAGVATKNKAAGLFYKPGLDM